MNPVAWLLAATLLVPIACAVAVALPRSRPALLWLAPFAPLPALGAAALPVGSTLELEWLILGTRFGIDAPAPGFLVLTAIVWSAVGFHLRTLPQSPNRRYLLCYFGAMAGNLGVMISLDPISYYTTFGVLTFAAYGLITTTEERDSRRAGRIYLILALTGELAILVGFMAEEIGFAAPLALWMLYAGMGVKHGLLPFHVWLPVAHGTAPTPSSALLSGAILKAGLIGWLRFLAPEQAPTLATAADAALYGGLAAALLAAVAGILQRKPKMLLGYSSVSQMGLITAAAGAAAGYGHWQSMLPLLVLMAFHHATVKGALFLGMGVVRRPWVWPTLLLLSLSLAAAPGTGGALAKDWLKESASNVPALDVLWLTSIATTLLMARFLFLARKSQPHADASPWPFLALACAGLIGPWLLLLSDHPDPMKVVKKVFGWATAWPVLAGIALVLAAWLIGRAGRLKLPALPPGDLIVLAERAGRISLPALPRLEIPTLSRLPIETIEARLRRLPATGIIFFILLFALVVAWM